MQISTVENAFTNVNQTLYGSFDATMLNDTSANISQAILKGQVSPGYLFATLTAANATIPENGDDPNAGASNSNNSNRSSTDLAM